jgi:hypothetical protein
MAMDADFASDQVQQQQPQQHDTALTKQMNVQHLCDHRCSVQHMFGNAFRCQSSGQVRRRSGVGCERGMGRAAFVWSRVAAAPMRGSWFWTVPALWASRARGPAAAAAPHLRLLSCDTRMLRAAAETLPRHVLAALRR